MMVGVKAPQERGFYGRQGTIFFYFFICIKSWIKKHEREREKENSIVVGSEWTGNTQYQCSFTWLLAGETSIVNSSLPPSLGQPKRVCMDINLFSIQYCLKIYKMSEFNVGQGWFFCLRTRLILWGTNSCISFSILQRMGVALERKDNYFLHPKGLYCESLS